MYYFNNNVTQELALTKLNNFAYLKLGNPSISPFIG